MPDAPLAPDSALLFTLFNEVGIVNQLSTALFEARLPKGFLVSQFAVLNHLVRVGDGRTPLDLAKAFQVPKNTMTHTLALLERHAFVRVAPNPADGRSKCIWITEAGRSFRDQAIASLAPELNSLAYRLDMEAIRALVPMMANLRKVMDEARNG